MSCGNGSPPVKRARTDTKSLQNNSQDKAANSVEMVILLFIFTAVETLFETNLINSVPGLKEMTAWLHI